MNFLRCNGIKKLKSLLKPFNNFGRKKFSIYSSFKDDTMLSEEQKAIQDMAYSFAEKELLPNAHEWDLNHIFPEEKYKEIAKLGFSSIYVSDKYGGSGLGRLEASLIFEGLATGDVTFSAYLSIHNMCCWMISEFANEEQKLEWLPSLINMDRFISYCLTEPSSGSDSAAMKTTAVEKDGDFIINGSKCFISGAGHSKDYLLMCKTGEKEISCIKVDTSCKGLSFGKKEKKVSVNKLIRWDGIPIH